MSYTSLDKKDLEMNKIQHGKYTHINDNGEEDTETLLEEKYYSKIVTSVLLF